MNRFRNVLLRKCKSLSRSLSSSYRNLRSMFTREHVAGVDGVGGGDKAVSGGDGAVVFVGSSRRRYVISNKHLSHPLIAALIDDVPAAAGGGDVAVGDRKEVGSGGGGVERRWSTSTTKPIAVNCEIVLFDHLLWMLDNAVDLRAGGDGDDGDAMRELAQLYTY